VRRSAPITTNTPGCTYDGRYIDDMSMRLLAGFSYIADQMATEKCMASCSGYKLSGLQYGREVRSFNPCKVSYAYFHFLLLWESIQPRQCKNPSVCLVLYMFRSFCANWWRKQSNGYLCSNDRLCHSK